MKFDKDRASAPDNPKTSLWRRTARVASISALVAIAAYAFYFVGVILFLNTPLFRYAAEMMDTSITHVKPRLAWSLYPGHLRARALVIAIRDQNVIIDVNVKNLKLHFNPRALLQKTVVVTEMSAEQGTLNYVHKDPEQSAHHHAAHSTPEDQLTITSAQKREIEEGRWAIDVKHVKLMLTKIDLQEKHIAGLIRIDGAFYLKPGVEAEVYPTTLSIENGTVNDELQDLQFQSKTAFHRFFIPETGGNKVFRHFDTDITLSSRAKNLELLNITLRSLEGYRFQNGRGNLRAEISARKGELLAGSHFDVTPSDIEFAAPSFNLQGKGQIHWKVPEHRRYSSLAVTLKNPGADVRLGEKTKVAGKIGTIQAGVKIYGLNLSEAFHGLIGGLEIKNGVFNAHNRESKTMRWSIASKLNGRIAAVSGEVPEKEWRAELDNPAKINRLSIDVLSSNLKIRDPKIEFEPQGQITLAMPPVDFRQGNVAFKALNANFTLAGGGARPINVGVKTVEASHHFSPENGGTGRWYGESEVRIEGFSGLVDTMKGPFKIPSLVATLAKASDVTAETEWEFGSSGRKWIRAKSVDSSGIWSVWGTYLALPGRAPTGAFEGRILGIPVGVILKKNETPFTVFPSKTWYDSSSR